MSAHTPGPLEVDTFDEFEGSFGVYADAEKIGSKLVASCRGPNAEANATLFAAAPDMLAALDELVAWTKHLPSLSGGQAINYAAAKDAARAAISKARGITNDDAPTDSAVQDDA